MPVPVPKGQVISSYLYIKYTNVVDRDTFLNNFLVPLLRVKNPEWERSSRFVKGNYWKNKVPEFIDYFSTDTSGYILPRNLEIPDEYLIDKSKQYVTYKGQETTFKFILSLRDYQTEYLEQYPSLQSTTDKVLEMPCGTGKTVVALWLAAMYNVRTIVLVPTHQLANQWVKRIQEFTNATYYKIKSTDKVFPSDKDIYVCSMELFSARVFDESFLSTIGHVIIDEAHRIGAPTLIPTLNKMPARLRTSLTATFRRSDDTHLILKHFLGEVFTCTKRFSTPLVYPLVSPADYAPLTFKKELLTKEIEDWFYDKGCTIKYHKSFVEVDTDIDIANTATQDFVDKKILKGTATKLMKIANSEFPTTSLETFLSEYTQRTFLCIKAIDTALQKGRCILFLSKRKNILQKLHKYYLEKGVKTALVIRETNDLNEDEQRFLDKEAQLIFGISQLAKEGLDIDRLDTLLLHLPIKDTEQAIGRISRLHPAKRYPVCLYIRDTKIKQASGIFYQSTKFIKINAQLMSEIKTKHLENVL